jgi:hypothetical protein
VIGIVPILASIASMPFWYLFNIIERCIVKKVILSEIGSPIQSFENKSF